MRPGPVQPYAWQAARKQESQLNRSIAFPSKPRLPNPEKAGSRLKKRLAIFHTAASALKYSGTESPCKSPANLRTDPERR